MKKTLLSTVALITIAGSASAADLPSIKSAPAPAPLMSWTGFYAGLNVGGGFGSTSVSSSGIPYDTWAQANDASHAVGNPASLPWNSTVSGLAFANSVRGGFNQSGVIGGLQLGYNYQLINNFVIGGEVDFQGSGMSGNRGFLGAGYDSLGNILGPERAQNRSTAIFTNVSSSIDWFGTVRGRVGYLFMPNLLVYATGGLTYAGVTNSIQSYGISDYYGWNNPIDRVVINRGDALAISGNKSSSNIALGWNVGGGFEYMLNKNWSIKTEAFYYNLGGINTSSSVISGPIYSYNSISFPGWGSANNTNVSYNGVIARAGVNYHFNLANVVPVVAKF
jgi:outer membrane immunogenic protein